MKWLSRRQILFLLLVSSPYVSTDLPGALGWGGVGWVGEGHLWMYIFCMGVMSEGDKMTDSFILKFQ